MATRIFNAVPSSNYNMGVPGMVASTSYKQSRQHIQDDKTVYLEADKKLHFGTAITWDSGELKRADSGSGVFAGIALNDGLHTVDYYSKGDMVIRGTLGDFWVRVADNLTISPGDTVTYLETATDIDGVDIYGCFSNAGAAAGIIEVPGFTFQTTNQNGLAVIAHS